MLFCETLMPSFFSTLSTDVILPTLPVMSSAASELFLIGLKLKLRLVCLRPQQPMSFLLAFLLPDYLVVERTILPVDFLLSSSS
jgi:hypothetical protein